MSLIGVDEEYKRSLGIAEILGVENVYSLQVRNTAQWAAMSGNEYGVRQLDGDSLRRLIGVLSSGQFTPEQVILSEVLGNVHKRDSFADIGIDVGSP